MTKWWPDFNSKEGNRNFLNVLIEILPFLLKCGANDKKLHHTTIVGEHFVPFETFEKFITTKKHTASEMTLNSSKDISYLEPQQHFLTNLASPYNSSLTQI